MLNYAVSPTVLEAFVPRGTELDSWQSKPFVSLVGFRFMQTRVFRVPVPFHCNFDEVNLRFYVRRSVEGEIRRGVVFIKEIVPRRAIAIMARTFYGEKYVALPMHHRIAAKGSSLHVEYGWRSRLAQNRINIVATGDPALPIQGSEEEFITEHFWGYSTQANGATVEYRVAHPSWRVWSGGEAKFEGDVTELYGAVLAEVLSRAPVSAFLAEGSDVTVFRGQRI